MKRTMLAISVALTGGLLWAQAPTDATAVARDVASKIAKVNSFSATLETGETAEDGTDKSTSDLLVSREYGWKLTNTGEPEPFTFVTDYKTFYQYFPQQKRVMKTSADRPEIRAMFQKPVTDMNPLSLVTPQSLTYVGKEELDGEPVYHVEGTTTSQLMPGGPQVPRTLSAWISVEDGLPRKTVESVGVSTGTTVYKNVKINPPVKPEDFAFTPPANVAVIDTNEQMRRMEQGMRQGQNPAGAPAQPPATR